MIEEKNTPPVGPPIPPRFTVPQRIEHAILAISFTVLGFTGLIQKFAANPAANRLLDWLGGIQTSRIIHRWAAAVFALLGVYHIIVLGYKALVRRVDMTMMPGLKDVTDAWNLVRYNLFLAGKPPQMPRYNFTEKLEYWALIWGGVIMAVTGFMLWNPLITTSFLPGQFIPAAKAAHGGEAILAVLAIIVWHFYNVHVKAFNKSMFTGRLTAHQMEEEHGNELSRIVAGDVCPVPDARTVRRRLFLFVPGAIAIAAAGAGTIYWAATAETTAVSTLPSIPHPGVAGPVLTAASQGTHPMIVSAPLIPHPVAGRSQCKQCHAPAGLKPIGADHEGRPVESCRICHRPAPEPEAAAGGATSGLPGPIPHSIEGEISKNCILCHGTGKVKPFPDSHASFAVASCFACHKRASNAK